jgi:hypothetical protein
VLSGTFWISGSVSDNASGATGLSDVKVSVDGAQVYDLPMGSGSFFANFSTSADATAYPQGPGQTVAIAATDRTSPPQTALQQASVILDQPPSILVSPVNGTGMGGVFTFTVTTAADVSNLQWIGALIGSDPYTSAVCEFQYWPPSNIFVIIDDSNSYWQASATRGTHGATLSNSQCTIDVGAARYVAASPGTMPCRSPNSAGKRLQISARPQCLAAQSTFS